MLVLGAVSEFCQQEFYNYNRICIENNWVVTEARKLSFLKLKPNNKIFTELLNWIFKNFRRELSDIWLNFFTLKNGVVFQVLLLGTIVSFEATSPLTF